MPKHDGARRGREILQQKNTRDRFLDRPHQAFFSLYIVCFRATGLYFLNSSFLSTDFLFLRE